MHKTTRQQLMVYSSFLGDDDVLPIILRYTQNVAPKHPLVTRTPLPATPAQRRAPSGCLTINH